MLLSWMTEMFVNNMNKTEDQMLQAVTKKRKEDRLNKLKERHAMFKAFLTENKDELDV